MNKALTSLRFSTLFAHCAYQLVNSPRTRSNVSESTSPSRASELGSGLIFKRCDQGRQCSSPVREFGVLRGRNTYHSSHRLSPHRLDEYPLIVKHESRSPFACCCIRITNEEPLASSLHDVHPPTGVWCIRQTIDRLSCLSAGRSTCDNRNLGHANVVESKASPKSHNSRVGRRNEVRDELNQLRCTRIGRKAG